MTSRQIIIAICATVCFGLIGGGTAFAQDVRSGPCVDDRLWWFSTDGDRAFADYAACERPRDATLRLTCRNGSSYAGIIVMLGDHVTPSQHVSLTFFVDGTGHRINGVTFWSDAFNIAGFDANLDFDGPLITRLPRAEAFSVETADIHLVGAAPAIADMLAHCGRT